MWDVLMSAYGEWVLGLLRVFGGLAAVALGVGWLRAGARAAGDESGDVE